MGCDQETVRLAEKIILPGDRDRLGCVTQIRVRATSQRDEFSLCTSKFESDHPSHAVGLADVLAAIAPPYVGRERLMKGRLSWRRPLVGPVEELRRFPDVTDARALICFPVRSTRTGTWCAND